MARTAERSRQTPHMIVILGPHRSGTSALSGVISHLGADLPAKLMPATPDNEKGYFESVPVTNFNDRLLDAVGTSWMDLAPLDTTAISEQVYESLMAEAVNILRDEFANARLPILKDPRICRLVDFWAEAISRAGYDPLYIHNHRNPLETARSLQKRDKVPVEIGLMIWLRHVLDAEAATRGKSRAFTSYSALMENWSEQIDRIEAELGFRFHRKSERVLQEIDAFLTEAAHRQHASALEINKSPQVAKLVRSAFKVFEDWTQTGTSEKDYARLDKMRNSLNQSLEAIWPILRAQEKDLAQIEGLERGRLEAERQNAALNDKIATLEGDLRQRSLEMEAQNATLTEKIAALESDLRQRSLEAEEWFNAKNQQADTLKALQDEHAQEKQAQQNLIQDLEACLDQSQKENASLDATIKDLEKKLADRFKEVSKITEILLSSQSALDSEKAARKASEDHAAALLSSTSWRLTAPLRKIVTFIRR